MIEILPKENLSRCYQAIRNKTDFTPKVAIILGSGLGEVVKQMQIVCVIPYSDIPGFPVSTVQGHVGRFLFGYINEVPVVVMQGRIHFYEGYNMEEVVLPIRIMRMLGATTLILTNSAGGVNESYYPGQLVLVKDHIASFVPNSLRGTNIDFLGTRFPDMSDIYSKKLREVIRKGADTLKIPVTEGIYLQTAGPSFESPAEIKMYRLLGADLVGMSTACEAIAAKHAGMEIGCISFVSNLAAGMTDSTLTMEEVSDRALGIYIYLEQLLLYTVGAIGKQN